MKLPELDHPITVEQNPHCVRITFNGHIIADTTQALELREATLPTVQYVPREDVDMELRRANRPHHVLPLQRKCQLLQYRSQWNDSGECSLDV